MSAAPRILLVGAGSMGSLHARVIAQSASATLARVVDGREDAGRALAERYDADWSPELGDLSDVDAVVIAASTEAHYDLALAVLEHDRPLLVEKPVADGLQKTLEIIGVSESRGIPMTCGLLERFNPAVVTARALVDDPKFITATRHSPYAPRIRTGVSWDLLVHDVDLASTMLGGEPTVVRGILGQFHPMSVPGAEDVAEAVLAFDGGRVAHVSASRVGQRKIRTMSIHDLDKLIEVDLLRRDVTVYRHVSDQPADAEGRGYRQQTVIEIPELMSGKEPLAAQLEHFVELVDGRVDADAERRSLIPAHSIVEALKNAAA
ncbi:Gfo/Idh/MocA family oxidoreductase [Agromyces mariniharenae]|uniref:Gfo/Idh/MocA family oxidoreductase n=1 Tax=Agromyces mariniharenae TaxID=2604423 RepID=A0A5S4V0S6_9MICO|nr:Gfo/Idh/MocA family oxidoreductase [Agromyces mariniharenae]TYL52512.1 Gfo/Idh/MocA family oxidoreductase [Agromyces mariniharenae]